MTCLTAFLVLVPPGGGALAADKVAQEYAVKAALVYNFARFTEWPADAFNDADEPLRIVVYGHKDLASTFASIDGKLAAGRRIEVVFANRVGDVAGCHMLFLAKDKGDMWPQVLKVLTFDPVLTIGEMNGFLESGGTMNLHLDHSKIRFEVNLTEAKKRGIHISSRILKLASLVIDEQREME